MKIISLTRGMVTMVDDDDYDFLIRWKWHSLKGRNTFYAARGYYNRDIKNMSKIFMHNVLLPKKDGLLVDHKDMDGLNNQKSNLRYATKGENMRNIRHRGKSKYRGVTEMKVGLKRWMAQITIDKKKINIGYFYSETEAAIAYNEYLIKTNDKFSIINNIEL